MYKTIMTGIVFVSLFVNAIFGQVLNHLEMADNHLSQGNYLDAINTLTNHIEQYPDSREAYVKRAQVYGMIGKNVKSQEDISMARILDPLYLVYKQEGFVNKITSQKKYDYDWIKKDSYSLYKSPINTKGYALYIKSFDMGEIQDSLITMAIQHLIINDLKKAEEIIEEVDVYLSNTGLIFDIKGLIALKKGDIEEALDLFTLATIHNPEFALAFHNKSVCHKLLGENEMAKQALHKAIALNADIATFYFTKALLSENTGNLFDAKKYYKLAINMNRGFHAATSNYAILMQSLGDYDLALEMINESIAESPEKLENYFLRGGIHLSYGSYEQSINDFEDYLAWYPNDSAGLHNLGLAYLLNQDEVNGCENIYKAQELGYSNSRATLITQTCQNL